MKAHSLIIKLRAYPVQVYGQTRRSQFLHTSARQCFLYDRLLDRYTMAADRVLVYLHNDKTSAFELAGFSQSVVSYLDPACSSGVTSIEVQLTDNRMCISRPKPQSSTAKKIKRPVFCPISNMSVGDIDSLPEAIATRGIDTGAAVILESGDGKILLTRRGDNLRTFPGIWVPPGGHIEKNETLTEAGFRELVEETGLTITSDMCQQTEVLALWESVFPPKLSLGQPKRHHIVVYHYAKLKPDITSETLWSKLKLDPEEVGACAWFDRTKVKAIVSAKEGEGNTPQTAGDQDKGSFRAFQVTEDKQQTETELPFCDLLKTAGDDKDQRGRVSTGTKFALEEWLGLMTSSSNS